MATQTRVVESSPTKTSFGISGGPQKALPYLENCIERVTNVTVKSLDTRARDT